MDFIPVNEPLLDGNEKKYLNECIDSGWISSEGPFVKKFEEGMANYVGRKYGVAVANGSVALDLAVEAIGLKAGDEVIMPTFTIISCASCLIRKGIKPVVVDCDSETWNMDVTQIESKITNKTKAIMVVHIYGLPVDMDQVMQIANKYQLKVIEDAAEAHGLQYKGKQCGSFGDISILSFYPNKHVTTGEGGMILTDDDEIVYRARSFRDLCFCPERRFKHEDLGYNFRMSNLQAAVGLAQLEQLNEHLSLKENMGLFYHELLVGNPYFDIPVVRTEYAKNVFWVYGIVIKDEIDVDAEEIMYQLKKRGIGTRPFFYPMHLQPVFHKQGLFIGESYPASEKIEKKGFYIPSGMTITREQQEYIADQLLDVFAIIHNNRS